MTKKHLPRNIVAAIQQLNADGVTSVSTLEIAERLGESRTTVGRYIASLVDSGRIERHGAGSATRYTLASVSDWLARQSAGAETSVTSATALAAYQAYETAKAYADRMRSLARPRKRSITAKAIGAVVVTPDSGVRGRYVAAVLGLLAKTANEHGSDARITAIGQMGVEFVRSSGYTLASSIDRLRDASRLEGLIGALKTQFDAYIDGETQAIYLIHASFIGSQDQGAVVDRILPVEADGVPVEDALEHDIERRLIEATVLSSVSETIALEAVLAGSG